ncbi:tyrosine-protein phosphatase [Aquibacillus sediminis]|uniref:tyrosine-protein phosphatase n=1 Tax=Aquibacillus sediminis TaxID=2574734 RepID=UPI001109762B|nr:CpsB/CapC family capsule biosynthesis tyrosine phosphatase [Aquibacillus sediminis]
MIDMHCHLLDGSKDLQERVEMASQACEQGVDTIVVAPHHNNVRAEYSRIEVVEQVHTLQQALQQKKLPITLLAGQLIELTGDIVEQIDQGDVLLLNEENGYVLLELPHSHVPSYTNQLLFDLQIKGYKPIIAHPEQNQVIIDNPNVLYEFVKHGALAQLAAPSVVGKKAKKGKKIKKVAHQLIEANLIHFIASDSYTSSKSGYYLEQAEEEIERAHGKHVLQHYREHAQALVDGALIIGDEPKKVRTKKAFGILW